MPSKKRADVCSCSGPQRSACEPARCSLLIAGSLTATKELTASDATEEEIFLDVLVDPDEKLRLEGRSSRENLPEREERVLRRWVVALGEDVEVLGGLC
jgi:hypothetical protein